MSVTGLRFFTVYGPWGRPDMAAFKFAINIMLGKPITIFQARALPNVLVCPLLGFCMCASASAHPFASNSSCVS